MAKTVVISWNEFFDKHKQEETHMSNEKSSCFTDIVSKCYSVAPICLTTTTDKIDSLGYNFLTIAHKAGFWIILIAGITQILRAVNEHDRKRIIETILTYSLMYGALYLLPESMKMIDSIFSATYWTNTFFIVETLLSAPL